MPTPRVRVTALVAGREYGSAPGPGIAQYSYESDVLQLGDPVSLVLPNPHGELNGKLRRGDALELYIADPEVAGGVGIRKLKGLITSRRASASTDSGSTVTLGGADLGWHLANNAAPLWFRLRGVTFKRLLERVLDKSWGFSGVRTENDTNRRLKLGRAGVIQAIQGSIDQLIPPIQIEPGELIADTLILFAKRERKLVNVSADGYLQIWSPAKNSRPLYSFEFHRTSNGGRKSNVLRAAVAEDIQGVFTDVICVGQVVQPPNLGDSTNPNEGSFRGRYKPDPSPLPFVRRITFSDGEQLTRKHPRSDSGRSAGISSDGDAVLELGA
jgi:prophage tail gpP-like protein